MTEKLIFQRAGTYYMTSTCGRYNVAKSMTGDVPKYSAWLNSRDKFRLGELLGVKDTAEEAQAICQEHANQQETKK